MPRRWIPAAAVLAIAIAGVGAQPFLDRFEKSIYDIEIASPTHPTPAWPDDLVLVGIDDVAITRYSIDGQWPIHRREAARIFDRLHALGAKTIFYDGSILTHTDSATDANFVRALDGVVLPIGYSPSTDNSTAGSVLRASLPFAAPGAARLKLENLRAPIEPFATASRALGHVVAVYDPDGPQRALLPVLVVGTSGRTLPSAPLEVLALQRGLDLSRLRIGPDSLEVPGLPRIALDHGELLLELAPAIDRIKPRIGMIELLEPKDPEAMRGRVAGKLALIYTENKADSSPSTLGPETYGGQVLAHAIRSLSAGHAPRRIPLGRLLLPMALALAAGAWRIARWSPRTIAGLTFGGSVLFAAAQVQLFHKADLLAPILVPELTLLLSGAALAVHSSWRADERADWHRAPKGTLALVFTDVQGSTALWDRQRAGMQRALSLQNAYLRSELRTTGGYEVKTEGDAFMIAFSDVLAAGTWCLVVQSRLLALDWPQELLEEPEASEVRGKDGALLYRGLRVRMGIHVGEPAPQVDPLTGRMDYFGPMVNKSARVCSAAHGGQILASGEAWSVLAGHRDRLPALAARDLGKFALKGLSAEVQLVELLPSALAAREFAPPKAEGESTGDGEGAG